MTKQQRDKTANPRNTRYIPVSRFDQYHPWPTPQSIRNRIHAAKRGNDPDFLNCVKYAGNRVLIDEVAFLTWIDNHVTGSEAA